MKPDDSSLDAHQYQTVSDAARKLLSRSEAWGRFPTPVGDLMAAANLKLAPMNAFDENAMMRYLREAGETASRFLRRAVDKVLGIFDVHANTVHIDTTVSKEKQTFLKLHETGHKELPHQCSLYRWIQDCNRHLAPEIAEGFEREANIFATIVLFQDDTFAKMTADETFGIKVPMGAARKIGASVYAGIREYVRRNIRVCAVIVLEPTETLGAIGTVARVRRIEVSPSYLHQFGALQLPDQLTITDNLMTFVPLGNRRMSSRRSFSFTDRNGGRHEFVGEGFRTPYNTFILIHAQGTLQTLVPAKSIASALL